MLKLWKWYQNCLAVHPVKTQVISSAIIWGVGDIAAQTITYSTAKTKHQIQVNNHKENPIVLSHFYMFLKKKKKTMTLLFFHCFGKWVSLILLLFHPFAILSLFTCMHVYKFTVWPIGHLSFSCHLLNFIFLGIHYSYLLSVISFYFLFILFP